MWITFGEMFKFSVLGFNFLLEMSRWYEQNAMKGILLYHSHKENDTLFRALFIVWRSPQLNLCTQTGEMQYLTAMA